MPRPFEKKLRRLFERVLLLSLSAPAVALSCSDTDHEAKPKSDAESDAGLSGEACAPIFTDSEVIFLGDGNGYCHAYHHLPCGLPDGVAVVDAGCHFGRNECQVMCPASGSYHCYALAEHCVDGSVTPGPITLTCDFCAIGAGRRPRGLVAPGRRAASEIGAYFANVAHLEAASIHAFRSLKRDLAAQGAPADLLVRLDQAAKDEIRHARVMRRFADRLGARVPRVRTRRTPAASVFELALDNAVEGQVREAFGALVVSYQASGQDDKPNENAFRRIARDETRHAALAFEIDAWLAAQLTEDERARVRAARCEAIRELERTLLEPSPELARVAKLPSRARQRAWIRELERELWSA